MTKPIDFFRAIAATGVMVLTLGGCSEAPDEIDYERYEVGSVVTLVSEPEPNGIFEFLTRLELAHDQLGFFVLDSYAKKVYRVDLDGSVQASMGGSGRGPGEFVFPTKIKSASDGVWVLDSGREPHSLVSTGASWQHWSSDRRPQPLWCPQPTA